MVSDSLDQIQHQVPWCPSDHVVVSRLDLDGELGLRIGQLQGYEQRFSSCQPIEAVLCLTSDVPPSVQEETASERSVGTLFELREHLVGVRRTVAAVRRQDFEGVGLAGESQPSQVGLPIRPPWVDNPVSEQRKEGGSPVVTFQLREFHKWLESGLRLRPLGTPGIAEAVRVVQRASI